MSALRAIVRISNTRGTSKIGRATARPIKYGSASKPSFSVLSAGRRKKRWF
jgi:hypothetical protein